MTKLWRLAALTAQARGMGYSFENLQKFGEFVKDPATYINNELGQGQDPTKPAPQASAPNPAAQIQGVELDTAKLTAIARAGGRRTYRVTTTAKIGKVEKKIVGVWDTETQNQNARDPAYARGTWVYWREE
jgi:hypothetical protein